MAKQKLSRRAAAAKKKRDLAAANTRRREKMRAENQRKRREAKNAGKKLKGKVNISGSKNAALPILCASLLTSETVELNNVPEIADIYSMIDILESFGAKIEFANNKLKIDSSKIKKSQSSDDLVKKMRASILIIGALLPRFGEVKMAFPGGCVLGKRSVAAHTHAFKELGAEILEDKKGLHIKAKKLKPKKIICLIYTTDAADE